MSNSSLAEIYFIVGVMIFILALCAVATYAFFKTFYKERSEELKRREDTKKTLKSESKVKK